MPAARPLTPKESAFCDAYETGLNATQAYIKAGYSAKSAHNNASTLMAKEIIRDELDRRAAAARKRHTKTSDDVIEALSKLAFTGMSRFVKISSTGHPYVDMAACTAEDVDLLAQVEIESYIEGEGEDSQIVKKIKLKPYSRLDALTKLAQYFGLLNGKKGNEDMDRMASLMKEIMERGSTLPVRVTGPLGSKRSGFLKLVNPATAAE